MAELLQSLAALGGSLPLWGVACALWRHPRWSLGLLVASLVLTLVLGVGLGALSLPGDLWGLPGWTGLGGGALALVLWALWGALAVAAGGARLPGPPLLGAALCGALLGEVAGTLVCVAGVEAPLARARLALAASAGGLLGRLGDPTLLLLWDRLSLERGVGLVPLGLLCLLVALPGGPIPASVREGRTPWGVWGVGLLLAVSSLWVPVSSLWMPLGVGCVALAVQARGRLRSVDLGYPLRAALVSALVMLATAGGLPELGALGIETVQETLGAWLLPLLVGASALLAVVVDSLGVALLAEALLARGLSLSRPGTVEALAAGAAQGGLAPLLVAGRGALRAGAARWLLQVILAALWLGLLLR